MDMHAVTAENLQLKHSLAGLARILASSGTSDARPLAATVEDLLESIRTRLDLELVCLRLQHTLEELPREMLKTARLNHRDGLLSAIEPRPGSFRCVIDGQDITVVALPLGSHGEIGYLAAGSARDGFPLDTERILLDVAAMKATSTIMNAVRTDESRRLNEEAARYKEDLLHQLVDNIAAEVTVSTPQGEIVFVNQTGIERTGRPSDGHSDWATSDLLHPDDLPRVHEAWARALATQGTYEIDVRSRCSDGVYRWVHSHGFPIKDANGNVLNWCTLHLDIHDRKQAEAALAESRRRLDLVINTMPAMAWSADLEGNVDFFNRHFIDYVGEPLAWLQNGGWQAAVHPDDVVPLLQTWKTVMATGKGGETEARLRRHDGAYRWFLMRVSPLLDPGGNVIRWYGVNTDVEDWRRTEEALRAREFLLHAMIDGIGVPMSISNAKGELEAANDLLLDFSGKTLDEMRNWRANDNIHPDDRERAIAGWRRAVETGQPFEIESRRRRADGIYRFWHSHLFPIRDVAGVIVHWAVLHTDIHDRKQAEESLRASELNLRQLTETIPQMLWSTDPDGKVEYSNARLQEFMGITAEEFEGHNWADCLHPDDREQTARLWAHCVATGSPYRTEARFCYGGKSAYRWCLTTGLPLRDVDGRIIKWHGACVDLHDWKMAQDELRKTQAELAHVTRVMTMGQLTASIAHELNQPLSGIMTNAGTGLRMLNAEPPNVDGARETARRTIRDAKRASEVISRLRALFAKRTTAAEIVDLNTAIQEVIILSSNELQRTGVSHRVQLADNLPYTTGDRIQLQQVILNFILNAAEAMESVVDRPKELLISTAVDETGHVRVAVKDAGIGFDPDLGEKVFSPFFTTKGSGMGIGLSVSRSIVENHHGRLWAERNEGPGATFCFSLPSALAPDQVGKA